MKSQINSPTVFFIGIAIGVMTILLTGKYLSHTDSGMSLTQSPKTFGDIKIWSQKPKVTKYAEVPEGFYQEHAKELWMTKDNIPFLLITQDKSGKISGLHLLKDRFLPVLSLEPLSSPGKWGNATYSNADLTGKPAGDVFKDLDFDGHFDFKVALDGNGNRISRSIFIDGLLERSYSL